MLKLPSLGEMDRALSARIYLATGTTDMRKGFDTLAALVRDHLGHDPLSGDLFLFVGRNQDRIKVLHWENDGYSLWYKRLEAGSFRLPQRRGANGAPGREKDEEDNDPPSVELKASELAMLLEGIDLGSIRRRRRFTRGGEASTYPQ